MVDGRLVSQNRDAVMEALNQGKLHIVEKPDGERYILHASTDEIPYDELAIYLNVLGGAGYYEQGPEMGIQVCLEGKSPNSWKSSTLSEIRHLKQSSSGFKKADFDTRQTFNGFM
jgi:hypothetical protein